MILPAVITGFEVSRIFIDGGSSLNLIYADTLRKMNISLANLTPTDTRFHGITPEKPNYPLGKILVDVQFGTLWFEGQIRCSDGAVFKRAWNGPWVCCGDFNEVLCQDEHFGL
jgi:hypothetical protein